MVSADVIELGDEIFFQAIREYLNRYKYSNANTSDLKNVIEDISGKNLDWFFKQWVYGKGWPKLNIKVDYLPYDDKIGKVYLDIQQTQISDYGKYTNLPLEFGFVLYNDETIYRIIKMTDEEQDFWLDSIPSFKNVSLNYGPSVRVLLELNSMISSAVGNYFAEAGGMKIYPNPAYSEIHLAFFRNVNKACISVYNMFGEKVLYQCILFNNNDESLKLDVSHLPTGIYNVSVLQNGMIMNTKIQIVK